jgi:hypothetical protein
LRERLAGTCPATARSRTLPLLTLAAAAAAAAALAVLHPGFARPVAPSRAAACRAPTPRFVSVAEQQYLWKGREVGVFQGADGRPYRVIQCAGATCQTWERNTDRLRVDRLVPGQRVLLAAMETY